MSWKSIPLIPKIIESNRKKWSVFFNMKCLIDLCSTSCSLPINKKEQIEEQAGSKNQNLPFFSLPNIILCSNWPLDLVGAVHVVPILN